MQPSLHQLLAAAILPLCVCAFSTPSVGRHGRVRTTPVAMKAGSNHLTFERKTVESSSLPILLFIPGIDGTGGAGSTQWPRLAPIFEVHAMSMSTEDRSSFTECVDSIIDFLQADERSHRAALIVGESTGAVLALGAALRTPEAISGLCLVNPATSYGQTPLSALAPLLPKLPTLPGGVGSQIYRYAPAFISPIFGKPNWFNTVVAPRLDSEQKRRATSATAQGLPSLVDLFAASEALASVLPAEALEWRLQALLSDGSTEVNAALEARRGGSLESVAALLLAGERDLVLPSAREVERLASLLPTKVSCTSSKVLPGAAHACLDDARALNLRLELELSGVLQHVQQQHAQQQHAQQQQRRGAKGGEKGGARDARVLPDPAPQSLFEGWLGQMRQLFSPLFYSAAADGTITRGIQAAQLPDGPLLLCGNHQLYGFDGPLLIEEVLRERGRLIRPMVFPPLLAEVSPLAPFPYPLPGTRETFERFGATPVSPRSLYRSLARGEATLLFPGGAREVFKRKGEQYTLFWPEEDNIVRMAARVNATLVPFSGIGGDESFTMALDTDEILAMPALGEFFESRVSELPELVPGDKFVPPFGAITPNRHYFLFGSAISTDEIDPDDREACAAAYRTLRSRVEGGMRVLQDEVRPADPYRELIARSAWETVYAAQAPGPAKYE